ncbi:hypothetical protein GQ457_09G009170 [Hibiscus cannabinus]
MANPNDFPPLLPGNIPPSNSTSIPPEGGLCPDVVTQNVLERPASPLGENLRASKKVRGLPTESVDGVVAMEEVSETRQQSPIGPSGLDRGNVLKPATYASAVSGAPEKVASDTGLNGMEDFVLLEEDCIVDNSGPYPSIEFSERLPRSGFKGDFPGWARSHDRNFLVRTAYEALRDNSVQSANALWKGIAGFQGLQRIKIFIWLLAKDKLLCNAERVRRHLSSCARCEACGAAFQAFNHPINLRDMEKNHIQSPHEIPCRITGFQARNHLEWEVWFGAEMNASRDSRRQAREQRSGGEGGGVSPLILWIGIYVSGQFVVFMVTAYGWLAAIFASNGAGVLPPRDWFQMNVDGARDHRTGLAACGGLIRDHEGRWVRVWAVHEGLVQAWALGLRRVVVEVDSLSVLRLMLHRNDTEVPMTIVHHIFELLSRDWLIKFVSVYREANAVADRLAKLQCCEKRYWWKAARSWKR